MPDRDIDVDVDVDVDVGIGAAESASKSVKSVWRNQPMMSGSVFPSQPFFVHNNQSPFFLQNVKMTNLKSTTEIKASTCTSTDSVRSKQVPTITKNVKLLILGNAKCGKSSLINRYCHGTFSEKYKTTVGADFIRKDIAYQGAQDSRPVGVRLQLWDIAGQDRFQKLTRAYFSKARGVIIVCDLNRDGTIDAVRQWKREVSEWAAKSGHPDLPIILLANKSDMLDKNDPQAAFKMGVLMERLCREENFLAWFLTSARSGDCVDDGFNVLVDAIMKESHAASNENQDNPSHLDSNTNTTTSDTTSQSSTRSFQLVPDTSDKSSNTPGAHTGWCYS